jgi:hypothetical protein
MTGPVRPIETHAYGCRFRSRTEARWAVFMTEAGFGWEYEPEGLELEAGRYLPDFRVSANGMSIWLEIKPPVNAVDDPRWAETARRTGLMLFTVRGMHRPGDRCETDHSARVWHPDGTVADVHRLWQGSRYEAAWTAANSARFEHGETPRGRRKKQ